MTDDDAEADQPQTGQPEALADQIAAIRSAARKPVAPEVRWPTLARLAKPFPRSAISTVTVGGGRQALYVSHADTTAAALARYGPHSIDLVEMIYGDWPETVTGTPDRQRTWPAGRGVVGAVIRLTLDDIDGTTVAVTEVGDCPQPGQRDGNGHRAQIAYGNAYRRAWSRLGLGLGLWRDDPHGTGLAHAIDPQA